jgi:hypothetical protein
MLIHEIYPYLNSHNSESELYEITLKGQITSTLEHIINDLQLNINISNNILTLVGCLPDQSALLGLLNALNDTRHEILSVRVLDNVQ